MIDRKQRRFLAALSALMAKIAMADCILTAEEVVSARAIWSRLGLWDLRAFNSNTVDGSSEGVL